MNFVSRHWTALLIVLILGGWAFFYLPDTPSYAIFELKQCVDARNGAAAADYVDFQKVVQAAGAEMIEGDNSGSGASDTSAGSNLLGQLLGKGMVNLFSGPMAALLRQWAVQQVNDGVQQVQMPPAAVAGAIALLHRDGDAAYTRWTDHKGQVWEVQMAREDGRWKIVEVKNVRTLLEKLRRHEEKELNQPSP
ncbi:MAG TPA: hypothetical protein VKS22_04555 [Candidatus Binataceae bacterium]|nr:hypothetical protein [Candidatus Binataceae bacterium]